MKPLKQKGTAPQNGHMQTVESHGGVDLEADIVLNEDDGASGTIKWEVESVKFSVKHPVITSKFANWFRPKNMLKWIICPMLLQSITNGLGLQSLLHVYFVKFF